MIKNGFSDFDFSKALINNLTNLSFTKPTKVQANSINPILKGKNVLIQAKTGSGKTLAFALPLANRFKMEGKYPSSLILAPTRELANQIANEIRKIIRYIPNVKVLTLCGGLPFKPQVNSLSYGANILVATPGRLLRHLEEKNISLDKINYFVLDEADKMLDMGFYEDILKVINKLPNKRQNLLFSATYEENIQKLVKEIMDNFEFIKIHEDNTSDTKQIFYKVNESSKSFIIPSLISSYKAKSILIFCNMKIKCEEIADNLEELGLDVLTLHSDLEQKQRDETLILFSNKSYPILIVTDIASRGLDIDDIDLIINYDLAKDKNIHTHRIGRTARAGKKGISITLYTNNQDELVEDLQDIFKNISLKSIEELEDDRSFNIDSEYRTIYINAGKKQKLRAGDILGALSTGLKIDKNKIGKIDILNFCSYVAIKKELMSYVLKNLPNNKIKGKFFKIYEK